MKHLPPRTFARHTLTAMEIQEGKKLDYTGEGKPRIRAECEKGIRPCPYVSCTYNLYLDIKNYTKKKGFTVNFPHLDPTEMGYSCVLDVVDDHPEGLTRQQVAELMNVSPERVRQIESLALYKVSCQTSVTEMSHDH